MWERRCLKALLPALPRLHHLNSRAQSVSISLMAPVFSQSPTGRATSLYWHPLVSLGKGFSWSTQDSSHVGRSRGICAEWHTEYRKYIYIFLKLAPSLCHSLAQLFHLKIRKWAPAHVFVTSQMAEYLKICGCWVPRTLIQTNDSHLGNWGMPNSISVQDFMEFETVNKRNFGASRMDPIVCYNFWPPRAGLVLRVLICSLANLPPLSQSLL